MSDILNLKLRIDEQNKVLRDKSPEEIIFPVLPQAKRRIITTNFGSFYPSLLYAVISQSPKISVICINMGYNTYQTHNL